MSGEPKTRVMTLEEAMREVHFVRLDQLREKHGNLADVQVEIVEDGWWVFLNDDGKRNNIKEFGIGEWEAAFSYALGYKVVAPDESAELRAALDVARDAMVSALVYHHHSLGNPVKEELNAAVNRAGRALAGGENEK